MAYSTLRVPILKRRSWRRSLAVLGLSLSVLPASLQSQDRQDPLGPNILTLQEAEQIALRQEPSIRAASLRAAAAERAIGEPRAAYFPTIVGNLTGTRVADVGTTVAAGALTTSSLSNRAATGAGLAQLITDFGRTQSLVQSARFQAQAQNANGNFVRAQVMLQVREAYYGVLGSEAVLKTAQAALANRQLVLRQVRTLQESSLKSTLDVNFATVLVSEAQLDVYRAQTKVHEARAQLSASLGYQKEQAFTLADETLPPPLDPSPDPLISQALKDRPDLAAFRLNRNSAQAYVTAQKRLYFPTVSLFGAAGIIPEHDRTLRDDYAAAGVNVSVPIFNGGLFAARHAEAELLAEADDKDVNELALRVSRDVQGAWLEANDAFQRMQVTAELVQQANEGLRLAQARYESGLGDIVELNEAQLTQTSAEIANASAKYDYLSRRADLDYAVGTL